MTDATLTRTKGQILKDTLESLFHAPEQFDVSPLCQPRALQRMLAEQYATFVDDGLPPRDLAVEGLKALTRRLTLEAIKQEDDHLAEGLVLIWHQYLNPILSGSARSISPVARVLAYCAQPNHLNEFLRAVQNADSDSGPYVMSAPLFRDVTDNGHGFEQAAKKQRRTYANYIQRAFETLARVAELSGLFEVIGGAAVVEATVITQPAPEVDAPHEVADAPAAQSSMLEAVVSHILREGHQLPLACGHTLPTFGAIERTMDVRSVKGIPLCPRGRPMEMADVKRMSGVLAGVPGSGRTSVLYQLADSWARAWSPGQPLAIYIRASELLVYARNRRSIHEFTARHVFPDGSRSEIESLGKELEDYEQTYGVLWLMDELDRLSESEQAEIIMQLAFSPAVLYAALPWDAERIARQMDQSNIGLFHLVDLTLEQQKALLVRLLARNPEFRIDRHVGYLALQEAQYLARLPLGVMAVFDQLLISITDRMHIVQCALNEYFERAGLPRPQFTGEWLTLDPTVRALLVMATVAGADVLWYQDGGIFTTRARFEQGNGWAPECRWELLAKTRLFEPHPQHDDVCRFFNRDILGCLIAKSETGQLFAHAEITSTNTVTPLMEVVLCVKRHMRVAYFG
jgi:hypothetical protein